MRSYREAGSPIPRDNEIMLRRSIRRNSNVPAINKSSSETPPRFIGPAYRPRVFSWWALLALLFPRIIPACRIPAASMDVSSRRSQEPLDLIDGISFPERISLNLGVLGGATRCKAPMYPNGVRQDDYPLGSLEATRRQAGRQAGSRNLGFENPFAPRATFSEQLQGRRNASPLGPDARGGQSGKVNRRPGILFLPLWIFSIHARTRIIGCCGARARALASQGRAFQLQEGRRRGLKVGR